MTETTDVLIIGGGPAGLTCAVELNRGDVGLKIRVVEADSQVGGISKTVNHNGNRIDLGGHRFFSKSDWVMNWWRERFPLVAAEGTQQIAYQNKVRDIEVASGGPDAGQENVMLLRKRLSRIYYRGKFFDYPLKFNFETFSKLGLVYTLQCGVSLMISRFNRRSPEVSLEDFFINRFGDKLYRTFFKDYTEKVWGESCQTISAEWGAQRIKGVSVRALLLNYLKPLLKLFSGGSGDTKTSLIEQFLYPKLGPGQLWEAVTDDLRQRGVAVDLRSIVQAIAKNSDGSFNVTVADQLGGSREITCRHLVSTMPIKNLLDNLQPRPPQAVLDVSHALPYRDFMSVGILVKRLSPELSHRSAVDRKNMPEDNWIYIQEPNVKVGRIQLFNNWSPYLVKDPDTVWLGMEYFCHDTDDFWGWSDAKIIEFARAELQEIHFIEGATEVLDACVIRVPKAYPAYFGAYLHFDVVREFLDSIDNLYVVGRNGMHRYNNQDHSMLTAKFAAESIVEGRDLRPQIWSVNIDDEYHEEAEAESA